MVQLNKHNKLLPYLLLAGLFSLISIIGVGQVISEFKPNPAGNPDSPDQEIELKGTVGALFTGYIITIESDDVGDLGIIDRATMVSGTFDTNGLLVVTVPDFENPSFTIVLSTGYTGTVGVSDIDMDNDGTADNTAMLGTVLDAIGTPDAITDEPFLFGTDLGGVDFTHTASFIEEQELIFRDGATNVLYAVNPAPVTNVYQANGTPVPLTEFIGNASASSFGCVNPIHQPAIHTATVGSCTSASSIICTSTNTWQPIIYNGELIAEVNDQGNDLGTIQTDFYISPTTRFDANGTKYLNRTLFINAVNPGGAIVRFYFTDAELNTLIIDSDGDIDEVNVIGDIMVTKVNGVPCSNSYGGNGGTLIIPISGNYGGDHYVEFPVSGFSAFSLHGGGLVLPAELGDFAAQTNTEAITLNWQTLSENNLSHFEIERSINGIDFNKLGEIIAFGNTQTNQHYQFLDSEPIEGNGYYRLKMVDFDGIFAYSKIVSARFLRNRDLSVIYQNLAKQIEIRNVAEHPFESVQLYNAMGIVVFISESITDNFSTIKTNGLANGMYYLVFQGQTQETIPVMIY